MTALRHLLRESLGLPSPRSVFESLDANGHGKLTKSMIEEAGISAGLHYDQIERLFKRCVPVWTWGRGGVDGFGCWVLGVPICVLVALVCESVQCRAPATSDGAQLALTWSHRQSLPHHAQP